MHAQYDPSKIKAVIFDFGAVLCRLPTDEEKARFAAAANVPVKDFWPLYSRLRLGYDAGAVDADEFWNGVADATGQSYSREKLNELHAADLAIWSCFEDASIALIHRVKATGRKVGLLTNMPEDFLAYYHRIAPWFTVFDAITCSGQLRVMKPAPEIYRSTLDSLGVKADEAIFVDDLSANVEGARAVGIEAHVFRSVAGMEDFLRPLFVSS
jgi:putative hydrolase of the HAD superfamily